MLSRRDFLRMAGAGAAAPALGAMAAQDSRRVRNFLLVTLDDLNWDSVGAMGCAMPGITPHIDRLASEGVLFNHAFVMTSICGPSRNAMMTGRTPHGSGSMGHGKQPPAGWSQPREAAPALSVLLHEQGFFTGAVCKTGRLLDAKWDVQHGEGPMGIQYEDRHPPAFYERSADIIRQADDNGQPFFLYANPIDPHRPFARTELEDELIAQWKERDEKAGRERRLGLPEPEVDYAPDQIEMPAHLPDTPEIREHLAPYYDSVHRGDRCVGAILEALEDTGHADDTLVIFLSDHGMGVPWAKWSSYYPSLRTPLIVRWPGVAQAGAVENQHVVSAIDILPTALEALGLSAVEGVTGHSLAPFLRGEDVPGWRESAYAAFNWYRDSIPEAYYPVRVEAGRRYMYVWNAYVQMDDEPRPFHYHRHEVVQTLLDHEDPRLRQRAASFIYRPVEELFAVHTDPGCWYNLVDAPEAQGTLNAMRQALQSDMKETGDPLLGEYRKLLAG